MSNKVVLAYSGGLDTSFCIPYLIEQGYEVDAITIDTGGFLSKEKDLIEKRAYELGARHYECIDISAQYYKKCLKYLLYGNVLRNHTYPLSVSSERAFQALAILQYCQENDATHVAHGSTGAGNDQIRFDLIFQSLAPEIQIITPIRDNSLSRQEEVDYLKQHGVNWSEEKKNYSINVGIWGTSVGGKETLTSDQALPSSAYPSQLKKTDPSTLTVSFTAGEVSGLNGKAYDDPIQLIKDLEVIGSAYAIGRDIHVGDTIIGIKGRVGFEAAAAMILIKAHQLLEKHVLSKWQAHWKQQMADWYGMMLHEGQFLDPVMRNLECFLQDTQTHVTGDVYMTLKPYHFSLNGISSPHDLMKSEFGQYGEKNEGWSAAEAKGFIKILSNQYKIYHGVNQTKIKL